MNESNRDRERRVNRVTGRVLKQLRKANGLGRRDIVHSFPELTINKLKNYEQGRVSPPAHLFFDLVTYYGGNWWGVEIALFDASPGLPTSSTTN